MSALVLDAGAFVAIERNDRAILARLRAAQLHGLELRTSAIVVGQVWRDPRGRQVLVARLLRAVDIRAVDEELGRDSGILIGQAATSDPIDATIILVAKHGDRIITSDPADLEHLAATAGKRVVIVTC